MGFSKSKTIEEIKKQKNIKITFISICNINNKVNMCSTYQRRVNICANIYI